MTLREGLVLTLMILVSVVSSTASAQASYSSFAVCHRLSNIANLHFSFLFCELTFSLEPTWVVARSGQPARQ